MKKVMGFWRCWGLVIGIVIGNGIFMLPAVLAPYGTLSLYAWVISGVGTIFIAFMLSQLAKRNAKQGGFYAYTRDTFGDLAGYFIAWGYWISLLTAVAAGSIALTGYLGFFIPVITSDPMISATVAIVFIWVCTAINITGMKAASTFQLVTSLLKLLPLFIVAIGGLYLGDFANTVSEEGQNEPTLFLIAEMVMITMWAYVGIEAVTLPCDDVISPEKNIPRALIAGTLTATVVYIAISLGVMKLIPAAELAQSTSPLADAATVILGTWGAAFIAIGALVSIFGNINANVLIVGIMPDALSKDKLIAPFFSKHNDAGIPVATIVGSGFLASLLVVMNYSEGLIGAYKALILLSTLTVLLPYAVSSMAELLLQRKDKEAGAKINWQSFSIAIIALIFAIFAIIGSGLMIALQGIILYLAGLPFYYWSKSKRSD